MSTEVWSQYDTWNAAIAEVVFPRLEVPQPVYLDLEPDTIKALATYMDVLEDSVESMLAEVVAGTLKRGDGPTRVFARHKVMTRQWSLGSRKTPPPFLALLATFCMAAEQMAAGDGMASSNYYGRLKRVLAWTESDGSLPSAFQRDSSFFWDELNHWLDDNDGFRGMPTAFSLSHHRHVGLPISQALIRSEDHRKLRDFFRDFGYPPGANLAASDLIGPLDDWISRADTSASSWLRRLWSRQSARSRIAETAAIALANWGGAQDALSDESVSTRAGVALLTLETGTFPRRSLTLSPVFYVPAPMTPRTATILSSTPPVEVDLVLDLPAALGIGTGSNLDSGHLLQGVLQLQDSLTERIIERRPRRLIPFRQDEASRRWIETQQVLLGDDIRILLHDDLLPRVTTVLEEVARPGWEIAESYPGQPPGWTLITRVEILNHPGDLISTRSMNDLAPLIPLATGQLKVAGGFALPGRARGKWHRIAAPEIRALSDGGQGFTVELHLLPNAGLDEERSDPVQMAVWDDAGSGIVIENLRDLNLSEGDYEVRMVSAANGETLISERIRLRSSDTPDPHLASTEQVISYSRGLGTLGVEFARAEETVCGHTAPTAPCLPDHEPTVPLTPFWTSRPPSVMPRRQTIQIAVPDKDSCIHTGSHYEVVDTVLPDHRGRPIQKWSIGRCRNCGLVTRYPTRLASKGRSNNSSADEPDSRRSRDLSRISPPTGHEVDAADIAFDAILQTTSGTWSQFERIVRQVEPSAVFVDQFARNLEVLGHIDIRRDPRTLRPTHWEVAPTALTVCGDRTLFAGFWSNKLYEEVASLLEGRGYNLEHISVPEAPTQYIVSQGTFEAQDLRDLDQFDVTFNDNSWMNLAALLSPLSQILDGLPRYPLPASGTFEFFAVDSASWVPVTGFYEPGSYRIRNFSSIYGVCSADDLNRGVYAVSTVQLAKHLAAYLVGRPLIAYDPQSRSLTVPLGADLPGLYGRATVAAAGLPPEPFRRTHLLRYSDVPVQLARHLYDLFSR